MTTIDPITQASINQLNSEIAALNSAILSGATSVAYEGKTVSYDSIDGMFRRLEYAQRLLAKLQNPTKRRPTCGYGSFSKGYTHQGWGFGYNRWGV